MSINRRDCIRLAGAAVGGSILGVAPGWSQGARFTATSGIPVSSLSYMAQDVAVVKGFMAAEGIEFKTLTAGGGSKLREIVAAGQIEFGVGDSNHPLLLTNRGRPAKILIALDNRSPLTSLVIRQELYDQGLDTMEKLAAWKRPDGSKPVFAVSSLGGGQHVYLSYLAEKLGVADRFVWLAGGAEKTMLGGLSTGKFDAMGAMPNWRFEAVARKWGQVALDVADDAVWNRSFGGPVPSTVAFALQTTIDRKPELVQAYVNGLYRALQWIKSASADEIYAAVADRYLGDFSADTVRREIAFLKPMHSYSGLVDEAQFANLSPILFREITEMKPVPYAQAVEQRFIQQARAKYGG
jgi:NitT/TauT family transport system substrate-binding protein